MPQNEKNVDASLMHWPDIAQGFNGGSLLVGNGFSQAVWPKFRYSSIYEAASGNAVEHPLSEESKSLFTKLGTCNFEMVLSWLAQAKNINQILKRKSDYIENPYENIRIALGEAIKHVHVPWEYIKDSDAFETIRQELIKYKWIYSTNYDLLLYWSIMSKNGGDGFKDFFWNREKYSGDLWFNIANTRINNNLDGDGDDDSTMVLYLHGALHLQRDPFTGITYKLKNRGMKSLLDILSIPLFVTEGSSDDKMQAIRGSDYLFFAYERFLANSGPLVVFGHSLSKEDHHLVNAIDRSPVERVAVSINPGNKSAYEIIERKTEIKKKLEHGREILFFDSNSHPLGSKDINIPEKSFSDLFLVNF